MKARKNFESNTTMYLRIIFRQEMTFLGILNYNLMKKGHIIFEQTSEIPAIVVNRLILSILPDFYRKYLSSSLGILKLFR